VRAILILTGLDLEARTLARELELPALASPGFAAFGRGSLRIAAVGLRAGRLESRWAPLLTGLGRPLVISAGVCGALDPRLGPGDLVVPERIIGPAGEWTCIAPPGHRMAMANAPSAFTGSLVTTPEVVATREAKAVLLERTGAIAADMESSLIVGAAAASGLPSLVVRGVSDDARQSLPPELVGLVTPEGRLRIARAAGLLIRPAMLPGALALRRATALALRAAARVLAALYT